MGTDGAGLPGESVQDLGFHHSTGAAGPVDVVWLPELRKRRTAGSVYAPSRLEFHLIQFVTSGAGTHFVDFEAIELQRGDVHYIRPGQVHSFSASSRHEALLLLFREGSLVHLEQLAPIIYSGLTDVLRPVARDFEFLVSILQAQRALDADRGSVSAERMGPLLFRAVIEGIADMLLLRDRATDPALLRARARAAAFEALIECNFTSARTLNWYANELQISDRSIARACRVSRGTTPKKMIDERVALEAMRLLTVSTHSIERIAFDLGFTEATNFVKFFRRVTGKTPDGFRHSRG